MNVFIKYFLEKMKNLVRRINEEGFVFLKFPKSKEIFERLLNTDKPDGFIKIFFIKYFKNLGISHNRLNFVYEDIYQNDYHEMHTHLTPSDFQAVVWVPRSEYRGRAFLYGTSDNLKEFYPEFGDICFMKTNDLKYIHGVKKLENDTLVRTLLISLNCSSPEDAHVTVSAELKPI